MYDGDCPRISRAAALMLDQLVKYVKELRRRVVMVAQIGERLRRQGGRWLQKRRQIICHGPDKSNWLSKQYCKKRNLRIHQSVDEDCFREDNDLNYSSRDVDEQSFRSWYQCYFPVIQAE